DLGAFTFDAGTGKIVFTASNDNADLTAYQIESFNISAFVTPERVMSGATFGGYLDVEGQSDTGESDVLVMHSEDRAITADDAISMDLIPVTLTIDGEAQSA